MVLIESIAVAWKYGLTAPLNDVAPPRMRLISGQNAGAQYTEKAPGKQPPPFEALPCVIRLV
jgi:hypothetical protein